uniref:Uncharacterized protein n=1 Tax=Acrobeloides nanus TaxID=290746 RepID=A0A914E6S2_9BILA
MSIEGEAFVSQEFKTPLAFIAVVFFVVSTAIICFCSYCTESVVNVIKKFFGSRRHQHPPKSPMYSQLHSHLPDRPDMDEDSVNSSEISAKQKIHSKLFRYGSCPPEYRKFPTISRYKEEEELDETPGCYISAV